MEDKEVVKLSKYLKHWAEHNESHKQDFLKWLEIARSKGLISIVDNLEKAIQMMDKCTQHLLAAYDDFELKP